jgi:CRISPR-associated (Cas) DxTHG family
MERTTIITFLGASLVFLFAAYLKSAKRVKIKGVYYGALELSDRGTIPAPVIDLSEFVEMFDWLTASERFIEMGDGGALARLLRSRVQQGDKTLRRAADGIEAVSMGLVLVRPLETMRASAENGLLIAKFWDQLTQLRNDLDHAGMRLAAMAAKTIQKKMDGVCNDLENLIKPLLGR